MDITGKLAQANGRLKGSRVGVRIEQRGDKLALVATLPPRPGSGKSRPYQQRIATGIGAHPKGVSLAELEARKVGALLDCNEFTWEPYLKMGGNFPQSAGEWIEKFTAEFKPTVSETTWKTEYQRVFSRLDPRATLTPEMLRALAGETDENTRQRKRFCDSLGKLAKFAGVEVDFKNLRGKYSHKSVDPRDLPTDEEIQQWFYKIDNPSWRWAFGMIATFGLRNHELFFLDTEPLEQGGYMVGVKQGKTGKRLVWACYPEWIEEFSLRIPKIPNCTGKTHADYGERVSQYFGRDLKLPFTAYDLRHRWAVRTLEFGLDISLAAQQMGHSVKVHSETYHHWITADTHQKAFNALMMRSDRPRPPVPKK